MKVTYLFALHRKRIEIYSDPFRDIVPVRIKVGSSDCHSPVSISKLVFIIDVEVDRIICSTAPEAQVPIGKDSEDIEHAFGNPAEGLAFTGISGRRRSVEIKFLRNH